MLDRLDVLDRDKKAKIHAVQKASQNKEKADANAPAMEAANEAIIDVIKKYKEIQGEYVALQEEKLYEKWTITAENGRHEKMTTNARAYVTFRSMVGKQKAQQLFEFAEANAERSAAENDKKFCDVFLSCAEPIAFSSIIMRHARLSPCNRATRALLIWLLALVIIAAAFYGMMRFKYYNDSLVAAASMNEACPPEVPVDTAYADFLKSLKQRQGSLHCKCLEVYNDGGGDVSAAKPMFEEHVGPLPENPCEAWKVSYDYGAYLTIISGAMIGILNAVCVAIFEQVPILFEGCLTYQGQTKSQFHRIIIIQFVFIACVLLFADFSLGEDTETGFPILEGRYRDFDTNWYFAVGSKISFAMISNSIAPFFGELAQPFVVAILRYLSRSMKLHLLKKTNVLEERAKLAEAEAKKNGGKPAKGEEGKDELAEEEEEEGGAPEEIDTYRSHSPLKAKKARAHKEEYEGGKKSRSFMADGGDDEGEEDYGDEDAGEGSATGEAGGAPGEGEK